MKILVLKFEFEMCNQIFIIFLLSIVQKQVEKGLSGCNIPAEFVLLRFVTQMLDKGGNSIDQAAVPAGPGIRTQRLIPVSDQHVT